MKALLQPRTSLLPPLIRAVYLQSFLKVFDFLCTFLFAKGVPIAGNLEGVVLEPISKRKTPDALGLLTSAQDDRFIPRTSDNDPYEELPLENNGENSEISSSEENVFTRESSVNLLNLIKLALKPLLGSFEVEILGRARNVLGLTELIKQEIHDRSPEEESSSRGESESLEIDQIIG